ncbi:succinate dehydrogenase, hydrophobic membrane anchor protein [Caulobacter mirabilis]|uniref:Succinate dehydrogenase hydrophobic membrane anchor subunit n=1 Tax=Caulobacter mirabilis TaxID=69666 RepID=A0A2D2B381_9CAUL|nr:succinate dehydrogenase, hydrophobic membrane anchor protein [Caulobacter mirabilis]ATQ44725.1 succinate dehydrogenase, hydrophobic membrane anchor protein [Caulobacter mirabilis]
MTGPSAFRTPLSRARGLGAAKHGVGHFIVERVTGLALIPLGLWGVFAAIRLAGKDWALATAWVAQPLNAVLLSLLIVVGLHHLRLTIQVVIEDYVYGFVSKSALLLLNLAVSVLGAALGVFAILKVALTGAF